MKRLALLLLLPIALAVAVVLMAGPGAQASPDATITVNSTADSGAGTLRQALLDAQSGDTTVFPPGSPATIALGSTLPTLSTGNDTVTAAPGAQSEPDIVSHWRCDEGSGTAASDSVDANDGTLDGATWTTGKVANALSFDGDDRVVIPDSPSLNPSSITVETWVKLDRIAYGPGSSAWQFFVSKGGDATTGAYILGQGEGESSSSSRFRFEIAPYWSGWIADTPLMALETGRWYHVAGTYDGNTMKIYLDGILRGSKDVGPVQAGNSSPLYFGYDDVDQFPYYLDGSLDEVAIFSRALTAPEIQRHYQNGLNNPVGGIAQLPHASDSSGRNYVALAGLAAALATVTAGAWYARRRWLG